MTDKARHSIYSKYLKYFSPCQKYLCQKWVYFYADKSKETVEETVVKRTPLVGKSVGE